MTKVLQFPGGTSVSGDSSYPPIGAVEMASRLKREIEALKAEIVDLEGRCPPDIMHGMETSCACLEAALGLMLSAFSKAAPGQQDAAPAGLRQHQI